jgi:hypothetical protein
MTPPEALLLDLDRLWQGGGTPRMRIRILGSMALMLQTDHLIERDCFGAEETPILLPPWVEEE